MTVIGLKRLQQAAAALNDGESDGRAALGRAAQEVWSATIDLESWPPALQCRCVPLQMHMVRHGPIRDTIVRSSDAELADLRQEILEFVAFAEELSAPAFAPAAR